MTVGELEEAMPMMNKAMSVLIDDTASVVSVEDELIVSEDVNVVDSVSAGCGSDVSWIFADVEYCVYA